MNSTKEELESVKVGDKVIIYTHGSSAYSETSTIAVVERVTKTQLIADNRKFNRITGRKVGDSDSWNPTYLHVVNAKNRESHNEIIRKHRRQVYISLIASKLPELTNDKLQAINKIIQGE